MNDLLFQEFKTNKILSRRVCGQIPRVGEYVAFDKDDVYKVLCVLYTYYISSPVTIIVEKN